MRATPRSNCLVFCPKARSVGAGVFLPGRSPKSLFRDDVGWTSNGHLSAYRVERQYVKKRRSSNQMNYFTKLTQDGGDFASCGFRKEINQLQSETVLDDTAPESKVEQKENLVFDDAMITEDVEVDTLLDQTYNEDNDEMAHLANYLQRPVLVDTYTWPQGALTNPVHAFAPWFQFLTDTRIHNKTMNFSRIRGKLHLKFVMNASPFF